MAMGIFEQLGWLTTRVKRLCCAIKVGAYKSPAPINVADLPASPQVGYTITEGGIYQFYGTSISGSTELAFQDPTSAGQFLVIANTSNVEGINFTNEAGSSRPYSSDGSNPSVASAGETWQFVSVDGSIFTGTPNYGFVWMGYKVYPNVI
jgi:hypothetical protein